MGVRVRARMRVRAHVPGYSKHDQDPGQGCHSADAGSLTATSSAEQGRSSMLVQHDGHGRLRVLTLYVGHRTLITYPCSQGALGHISPVVIDLVLMTPVLTAPVLLHPYGQRAAHGYAPVVVLLLFWPAPPLHFL